MPAVTAALVKELRDMTGAGMMDCKKALTATDGDIEKAVEFLREKGLAAAAKKAGRIAAEGLVTAKVVGNKAVIVEVNSETDFVAKNAIFQKYVSDVADQIMASANDTLEGFLGEPWAADPTLTVEQELSEMISRIGEKLSIRRFEKLEATDGAIMSYVHGGGRIGVLVQAVTDQPENEAVLEAMKNVAMQIAALRPQFTDRSEVPADFIEKETEILKAQIMNDPKEASKPEKVIAGIVVDGHGLSSLPGIEQLARSPVSRLQYIDFIRVIDHVSCREYIFPVGAHIPAFSRQTIIESLIAILIISCDAFPSGNAYRSVIHHSHTICKITILYYLFCRNLFCGYLLHKLRHEKACREHHHRKGHQCISDLLHDNHLSARYV